jgi:S1-C subfamily serine protease
MAQTHGRDYHRADRMAKRGNSLGWLIGLVKLAAIVVGLVLTTVSLMAIVGHFSENLWARVAVAGVLGIGVPLWLVNRFVPDDPSVATDGLPTDVLSVLWLAFGVLFVSVGYAFTRPMLLHEGDHLARDGYVQLARGVWWLAGARGVAHEATATTTAVVEGDTAVDGGTSAVATIEGDAGAVVPSDRPERTPAQLFEALAPAVVTLNTRMRGDREARGGGTGFFIDRQGTIVTNHHVIDQAHSVEVRTYDNTVIREVELLYSDASVDLAILRVTPPEHQVVAPLGNSESVRVGERVISIGNPLGLDFTLTDGLVSARRVWEGKPMIQMSTPVSPGNSGGPLFNLRGEVVGVTTAQIGAYARGQNLNLAVPVNVLKSLLRSEYPSRRRFGADASAPSRW